MAYYSWLTGLTHNETLQLTAQSGLRPLRRQLSFGVMYYSGDQIPKESSRCILHFRMSEVMTDVIDASLDATQRTQHLLVKHAR